MKKESKRILYLNKIVYKEGNYIIDLDNITPNLFIKKLKIISGENEIFIHVKFSQQFSANNGKNITIESEKEKKVFLIEKKEKYLLYDPEVE